MRSGTMNNTTVMVATVMYSNNNEMQQQQSKQIAKKSNCDEIIPTQGHEEGAIGIAHFRHHCYCYHHECW